MFTQIGRPGYFKVKMFVRYAVVLVCVCVCVMCGTYKLNCTQHNTNAQEQMIIYTILN